MKVYCDSSKEHFNFKGFSGIGRNYHRHFLLVEKVRDIQRYCLIFFSSVLLIIFLKVLTKNICYLFTFVTPIITYFETFSPFEFLKISLKMTPRRDIIFIAIPLKVLLFTVCMLEQNFTYEITSFM